MHKRHTIILIDSDFRRRAIVSHVLAGTSIHVEPYENLSEIVLAWPRDGLILACDENDQLHQLLTHMSEAGRWLPLVAYAPNPSTPRVVQAVLAGALDYLDWPVGESEVRQAIAVAEASEGLKGSVRLREAMARSRVQKLTRREREVLAGVADGLSNRLIGERLEISPRTVEIHRANMLTKMGASHTSEAIRIAIEASLVA
jgi:FixJ family two-component response regulator